MNSDNQPKTREEWYALVETQRKSNLTQLEFCKQNALISCRFSYYSQLYRKQHLKQSFDDVPSFSPVVINKPAASISNEIKIDLPNDLRCQAPSHISPEQLKKIIGALLSC
jgi:hypothetical protein